MNEGEHFKHYRFALMFNEHLSNIMMNTRQLEDLNDQQLNQLEDDLIMVQQIVRYYQTNQYPPEDLSERLQKIIDIIEKQ